MSRFKVAVKFDGQRMPELDNAAELFITGLVAGSLKGLAAARVAMGSIAFGFTDDPERKIPSTMAAPQPVHVFIFYRDELARAMHKALDELFGKGAHGV